MSSQRLHFPPCVSLCDTHTRSLCMLDKAHHKKDQTEETQRQEKPVGVFPWWCQLLRSSEETGPASQEELQQKGTLNRACSQPSSERLDGRVKWASPQSQPLLHLPEEARVELVQRLKGGEERLLQGVWSRLVLSYCTLERLESASDWATPTGKQAFKDKIVIMHIRQPPVFFFFRAETRCVICLFQWWVENKGSS